MKPLTSPNLPFVILTPPSIPESGIPQCPASRIFCPDPSGFFPFCEGLPSTDSEPVQIAIRIRVAQQCARVGEGKRQCGHIFRSIQWHSVDVRVSVTGVSDSFIWRQPRGRGYAPEKGASKCPSRKHLLWRDIRRKDTFPSPLKYQRSVLCTLWSGCSFEDPCRLIFRSGRNDRGDFSR
jgi:hypothetical protein